MPIPANHVNRSEEQSESGERGDETEGRPLFQWRARLPSLDGWRAISLVLVLGSHTAITAGTPPLAAKVLNRVFDGALGVRFFFVISGFLITWLMMVENQRTGTVSLRHFYVRRALRILPVYLVFLGVLAGLQWCTPLHQSAALWVGNLTFTTNFLYEPGMNGHQSAHLWSLAVEEQFYLLWPVAFLWLRGKEPLKVACWLVGGAVAVVLLNRWLERLPEVMSTGLGRLFQEWSFFNSVDSLAMGCAAALLLGRYPQQVIKAWLGGAGWRTFAFGVILIQCPYVVHKLGESPSFHDTLGTACDVVWYGLSRTIQSFGFVLLVLHSVTSPQWLPYRLLNHALVARVGVVSYSAYIWQQLFCSDPATYGIGPVWWLSFPGWIVPVIPLAFVSYYGLECPFLKLRHRFR